IRQPHMTNYKEIHASSEKRVEWLTQVIIPRSKNALLSINMTLNPNPSQDKLWEGAHSLLRDHSGRVREMSLNFLAYSGWQPDEVKGLLSRLKNPLPFLEILHVSTTGDAERLISIPMNVVEDVHAPNLKSLTLSWVKLVSSPRATSLITTLTLEFGMWSNLMLTSTGLGLDDDSSSDLADRFFDSPVVLRDLKRLALMETSERCLRILSSISCPAATNIEIITHCRHFFASRLGELGEKVAILVPTVKFLTIKVASLYKDPRETRTVWLSLRGPRNIENESCSPSDLPVQAELKLSIHSSVSDEGILSPLLPALDLQELEILEISPRVPLEPLKENFGKLLLLHTIVVLENRNTVGTNTVAEALVPDGVSARSDQSSSWYLGVRNARLNPRIVDVDAQNEELSIEVKTEQRDSSRMFFGGQVV
ncbi:hypothetical protein H0H93_014683, partial [Arthromyces matolae]